jgi:hypothetical protein
MRLGACRLVLRLLRTIAGGQLQDGRALPLMQVGHQHDLAARQLERIMMHARLCFIDTSEPCHSGTKLARRENTESGFAFDLAFERKFGSRLQANSHVRLADSTEPARKRV